MDEQTNFVREALPHDLKPYEAAARATTEEGFWRQCPYPFLLFSRSKLWDPTLLIHRGTTERGRRISGVEGTQLVSYDFDPGGMVFVSPVRKRQTDANQPGVILGRATNNDVIVPVPFVSTAHARFVSPSRETSKYWHVTDLGTTNGTFLEEGRLEPYKPVPIRNGQYLRLGGNLIAWFLHPKRLWFLFRNPEKLAALTDL